MTYEEAKEIISLATRGPRSMIPIPTPQIILDAERVILGNLKQEASKTPKEKEG